MLKSGIYPRIWKKGLIPPMFKSGDNLNPNNYRGISVNSNLGKLFCSILNSRILSYLTDSNVLSKSQIGFIPKHRTTDYIFTLHTLIQKHVHQKIKGKYMLALLISVKLLIQFGTMVFSISYSEMVLKTKFMI